MKKINGGITAPDGFLASGISCGIKESGNRDLALVFCEQPAMAAGVFTSNEVKAAPVLLSRERLENGWARAVFANSGNANACTGEEGRADAEKLTTLVAEKLSIEKGQVLNASTGIIGHRLPVDRIEKGIPKLVSQLSKSGLEAAEAILTTDTEIKQTAYSLELPQSGKKVRIGGMVKGAGMIYPDMATLLGFITTDLAVEQKLLQQALDEAVDVSFNRISVDGDQSTNDCVFLFSKRAGEGTNSYQDKKMDENILTEKNDDYNVFVAGLKEVAKDLAQAIVRDGEGATKFITIKVSGARDEEQAENVAHQVANSNLVKTACFGSDPNWGRILAAAGAGGSGIDPEKIKIVVNGQKLYENGKPVSLAQADLKDLMKPNEIEIMLDLQLGDDSMVFWTSDLSYEYIEINAEYHT